MFGVLKCTLSWPEGKLALKRRASSLWPTYTGHFIDYFIDYYVNHLTHAVIRTSNAHGVHSSVSKMK